MIVTIQNLDDVFTYHSPEGKISNYTAVREGAKAFAKILLENTPPSADQSAAIRKLRECVMTANASIALDGKY